MTLIEILITLTIVIVFLSMYITCLKVRIHFDKEIIKSQNDTIEIITDYHNELLVESVSLALKISVKEEDYELAQKCKEFLDKHIYKP